MSVMLKFCIIILRSLLLLLFRCKLCYCANIMLISSSLLSLMFRILLSWCWSSLLWVQSVDSIEIIAATWWFAHAPCYYSSI